jgi:hypothetical protein
MAQRRYLPARLEAATKVDGGYKIRVALVQSAAITHSQENLWIETLVAAPPTTAQQGWELEILRHVRDLLTEQIEAMRSP